MLCLQAKHRSIHHCNIGDEISSRLLLQSDKAYATARMCVCVVEVEGGRGVLVARSDSLNIIILRTRRQKRLVVRHSTNPSCETIIHFTHKSLQKWVPSKLPQRTHRRGKKNLALDQEQRRLRWRRSRDLQKWRLPNQVTYTYRLVFNNAARLTSIL